MSHELEGYREAIFASIAEMAKRAKMGVGELELRAGLSGGVIAQLKRHDFWPLTSTISQLCSAAGVTAEEWARMVDAELKKKGAKAA